MPDGGSRTSLSMQARFMTTFSPGGLFTPGLPPLPDSPQPVRRFDFPAGANLQYPPRAYEPFGFGALRAFANTELVRLAIETRKDQIERQEWCVRPRKDRKRAPRQDGDDRARKVEKLLRRPDGVTDFTTWMRLLMEDLLVLDAPAIERRRNLGGEVVALDVIDGATIKILIDETGRRPLAPAPAFQQVIKGRIWADLTTDDLIYSPRNLRPGHLYGFGPVEQIIVTINTLLRRQAQQLAYFTDGNLPQGLVNAPEGWTVDQLRDFQDWMDSKLSGNAAERAKLIWGPAGSKYQAFKESPIKDEFDEWLARVVCFAFSIPATPFVRQLNRSTSETDARRGLEEGLAPLQLWAKRLLDGIIQDDFGYPDLEFAWLADEDIDPETRAQVHNTYVRAGILTPDEVRDEIGREAIADGAGAKNLIYTARGVVPMAEAILPRPEDNSAEPAPDVETPPDDASAAGQGKDKES